MKHNTSSVVGRSVSCGLHTCAKEGPEKGSGSDDKVTEIWTVYLW